MDRPGGWCEFVTVPMFLCNCGRNGVMDVPHRYDCAIFLVEGQTQQSTPVIPKVSAPAEEYNV